MLKKKTMGILADFGGISPTKIRQFPFLIERRRPFLDFHFFTAVHKLQDEDADTKIYYHILKTDYYEQDASEITGLNTVAFGVLFPVQFMDSCEEMKIQEWPAAL